MPKNNKIYWFEGVTEKGVKALLSDEHSKFICLRSQGNRRVLIVLMSMGLVLVAFGSYWPSIKQELEFTDDVFLTIYSIAAVFAVLTLVGGYTLLRISVRGIADAPDELLDERQIKVRNTSFRYSYMIMGYVVTGVLFLVVSGPELRLFQSEGNDASNLIIALLFTFASLPSMVLAWREKSI